MQGHVGRRNGVNADDVGSRVSTGGVGTEAGAELSAGSVGRRGRCCLGLPSPPVLTGSQGWAVPLLGSASSSSAVAAACGWVRGSASADLPLCRQGGPEVVAVRVWGLAQRGRIPWSSSTHHSPALWLCSLGSQPFLAGQPPWEGRGAALCRICSLQRGLGGTGALCDPTQSVSSCPTAP